jgi:PhnB protein
MPPDDMFWGSRYGRVRDPFGHVWAFNAALKPA